MVVPDFETDRRCQSKVIHFDVRFNDREDLVERRTEKKQPYYLINNKKIPPYLILLKNELTDCR